MAETQRQGPRQVVDRQDDGENRPPWWSSRLTRKEAAKRLGTSCSTVRRLEERSELHPVQDEDDVHFFDPVEVATLARRRGTGTPTSSAGELAAAAFEMFGGGLGQREVVVALRQPPGVVRQLYKDWGRAGDIWLDHSTQVEVIEGFWSVLQCEHRPVLRSEGDLIRLALDAASMAHKLRRNGARRAERIGELRQELADAEAEIERLRRLVARTEPDAG